MKPIEVELTQEMIEQARAYGLYVALADFEDFGLDTNNLVRRFEIGILGEMAVIQWLTGSWKNGDWSVQGNRITNNHADLDCIGCPRVGVKTITSPRGLPMASEYNTDFQIIVRLDFPKRKAYILGMINPEDILNGFIENTRVCGNKHKMQFWYEDSLVQPQNKEQLNRWVEEYYLDRQILLPS